MKECRTCKRSLDESDFPLSYVNDSGVKSYRSDCKRCYNEKRRKTNVKKETIIKPLNKPNISNVFTDEEVRVLKLIARQFEIIPIKDKANRIPRTVNLDNSLFEKIQTFASTNNMSISDAVNLLIAKSLELLKN